MADQTVVYGEIIDQAERRRIENHARGADTALLWRDDTALFQLAEGGADVFVDLDDKRFASPEFLVSLATAGKQIKVIGKSGQADVNDAIRFSKLGVAEILSSDECLKRLDALLAEVESVSEKADSKSARESAQALIGVSEQIDEIRNMVNLLAEVDFPSALILGDTGTGKSLISKILHNSGIRAQHNLVEVNCSAIPDELFETELFGHAKGAFTDAKSEKAGLFEYAEGGTLFLDEVGNLSASAQAKLLKILEDKKLRKVGSIDEKGIDVRVVAATNLDLQEAIREGKFREDLFFRLNLLTIDIPPLRERPDDIPELVEYYLGYYATNYHKSGLAIEASAMQQMQQYDWPGNVRQLCNVIERAVLLTRNGSIKTGEINAALNRGRLTIADRRQIIIDVPPQGMTLQEIEQNVVGQVLNACNWNKTEAARTLGISRPRLRRIIEAAGLEQNRRQQ